MIIEFAGLPRSGKSSSLNAVIDYFRRKGFDSILFAEGAASCPFAHSFRFRTAFWVANKVLNDIIQATVYQSHEILYFQDRGLFDAMAFIRLLEYVNFNNQKEKSDYEYFKNQDGINQVLSHLANWACYIDIVILFDVDPSETIERDLATKLGSGSGIITNVESLEKLRSIYKQNAKDYGKRFPKIIVLSSSSGDPLVPALKARDIIEENISKGSISIKNNDL
jgi:thymidylate kinase